MDSLDNDTTNLIIKQIPVLERLQIYKVLNIPRPTQFQVSSELIASKNFRGNEGLIMLAIETGEYEPCVQAILMLSRNNNPPTQWEDDVRSYMEDLGDPLLCAHEVVTRVIHLYPTFTLASIRMKYHLWNFNEYVMDEQRIRRHRSTA